MCIFYGMRWNTPPCDNIAVSNSHTKQARGGSKPEDKLNAGHTVAGAGYGAVYKGFLVSVLAVPGDILAHIVAQNACIRE